MSKKRPMWAELAIVLTIALIVCAGLLGYSVILDHSLENVYLTWNLALAAIPLLLAWRLMVVLKTKRWSSWEALLTTLAWLIFLPNSFYMVSDYIHLQNLNTHSILFDTVMFSAFIFLAMFMGLISLYLVHGALKKRVRPRSAWAVIAIVLLGCCFAIYLGRDLRWNSWDVVLNPGGLLFDISNLLIKPQAYPNMGRTIIGFFLFLSSTYLIAWQCARLLWHKGVSDLAVRMRQRQDN